MGLCLHMTSIKIRVNKAKLTIRNNQYTFSSIRNSLFSIRIFIQLLTQSCCVFYTLPMLIHSDNVSEYIYLWRDKTLLYLSLSRTSSPCCKNLTAYLK